ncbi:MAG TPA: xanthine dehydrogenase family protein molybdopterin-binding subunit [Pseudoduganella sp.]
MNAPTEFRDSRRHFLQASLGAAGGLMLSFYLPGAAAAVATTAFKPNAFIIIAPDSRVTMVMPYVEMGQGTYTSIPILLADELEVDLDKITCQHAPADPAYKHGMFGVQLTGASASIRAAWKPLREAGATARTMLVQAAADQWKVSPESCKAAHGEVVHTASGRKLSYGKLSANAAKLPVPKQVALKSPDAYTHIGKSAKRLDVADKVNGKAMFGIDAQVPGMKIAAVKACPVFGGKLASVDEGPAMKVKGVRKVVKLENAVAVIADHNGAAKKGLAALDIKWDEGPNAKFSSAAWEQVLEEAARKPGLMHIKEGDFAKAAAGGKTIDAVYFAPFLAHATMEPMNCTAHVKPGSVEIWTGTQTPERCVNFVSKALGVEPKTVKINNFLLGGGFGRRLEVDVVVQAAQIARQVNYPVKVIWSREEDTQHDYYRPFYRDELSMALDAQGMPVGFRHRFVGSAIEARYAPAWMANGVDTDAIDAAESPYHFDNRHVEYLAVETAVPTGFWRGVGPTHNTFVIESFMDEVALATRKDPVALRQALLTKNPRALGVLNLATQKAGWGRKMEPGTGMGVSVASAWGSYACAVVECAVNADGQITLKKITTAVDCGQVVHPEGVLHQVESGQTYGLTAALYGKLTLENGRVVQGNFHEYPIIRMNEVPVMEVHVVPSTESPGGMGELGTAVITPAIANAVFAATGKRLRRTPFEADQLKRT